MKTKRKRRTRRNKKNQKVQIPPKNPKLIRRERRKIRKQPQLYYQQQQPPQQLCHQLRHVRKIEQSATFVLKQLGLKTYWHFVYLLPLVIPTEPPTEPYTEYAYPDSGELHTCGTCTTQLEWVGWEKVCKTFQFCVIPWQPMAIHILLLKCPTI